MRVHSELWGVLFRLPVLFSAAIYAMIYWLAPSQIDHIISSIANEGELVAWFLFIAPVVGAALAHLCLLSARVPLRPIADALLVNLPLVALLAVVGRTAPSAWPALSAALAGSLVACHLLIRMLAGRGGQVGYIVAGLVVATYAAAVVAVLVDPVALPAKAGPLAVVTIGVGLLGLLLAVLWLWPRVALIYGVVCLAGAMFAGPSATVELVDAPPDTPGRLDLNDGLLTWLAARNDLDAYRKAGRPYPVIIASAEGGGIYATAHAYLALDAMRETCPNFAQHLFATVGVSGGSVGNLLYAATGGDIDRNTELKPCAPRTGRPDITPLTTDLLSPVIANLLLLQTADFFIPGIRVMPDGGDALGKAVAEMLPGNSRLVEPLAGSWRSDGTRPVQLFVSTDVNSGNRMVFSGLGSSGGLNAETFPTGNFTSLQDIPSNIAAVISARFPWLTPSARIALNDRQVRVLADGGYFDNSGADTVAMLTEQIRLFAAETICDGTYEYSVGAVDVCECPLVVHQSFSAPMDWSGCGMHIFLAYMPISAFDSTRLGEVYDDIPNPPQSYLADPIVSMLSAWQERGALALYRTKGLFAGLEDPGNVLGTNVDGGVFAHTIPIETLKLPLGWKLSREAVEAMLPQIAPTAECLFVEGGEEPDSGGEAEDNACNMKMLAWLFNPAGDKNAHGISSWGRV